MPKLTGKRNDVINLKLKAPYLSLSMIAENLNISRERVRQILKGEHMPTHGTIHRKYPISHSKRRKVSELVTTPYIEPYIEASNLEQAILFTMICGGEL